MTGLASTRMTARLDAPNRYRKPSAQKLSKYRAKLWRYSRFARKIRRDTIVDAVVPTSTAPQWQPMAAIYQGAVTCRGDARSGRWPHPLRAQVFRCPCIRATCRRPLACGVCTADRILPRQTQQTDPSGERHHRSPAENTVGMTAIDVTPANARFVETVWYWPTTTFRGRKPERPRLTAPGAEGP